MMLRVYRSSLRIVPMSAGLLLKVVHSDGDENGSPTSTGRL